MSNKLNFPDETFAVFNLHVNNAGSRSLNVCEKRFGADNKGFIELQRTYRTGVMAIFNTEPTPVTRLFTSSCFIFVNGLDTWVSE